MKHHPKIAGKFRSHKTIALVAASLIISTLLWVGSTKEEQNTHYLTTVGSCNQQATIKIYDETGGVDPFITEMYDGVRFERRYITKPINTIENKYFKNYVTNISKYIFTKVDAIGQCQETSNKPQVQLVFVYRPAISRGIAPFYDFNQTKSQDTKQLDSPWVKITLDRSPNLNVRAVFIWNERQFLLDQASIWEGRILDTKPPMPIALETFEGWENDYNDATPIQETILAEKLPADIGWLFKNAWIEDCGSTGGSARCGLKETIEREKLGYTELTQVLIDQFFASAKSKSRYDSVLDLKDVFNIDKYQID